MVGNAYSFDYSSGYSCILIKAYDCEDLSFVNDSSLFKLYRVHRGSMKVELVSGSYEHFHLSLRHIKRILELITLAEYDNSFPVVLSWSVTPSGNLLKKQVSDLYSVWPVPPCLIENETPYINITELCFKYAPSELQLSFTAEVLNMVSSLCGITSSLPFAVCGSNIYCSSDIAGAERELFGSCSLYSYMRDVCNIKNQKYKIKSKQILSKIQNMSFSPCNYGKDVSEWIANIKRECVCCVISSLSAAIREHKSFNWLMRRIKHTVSQSTETLTSLGTELISRSTVQNSSDIKKLSFDELLMAFTFADSMRDITKNIRISKLRRSAVNKLIPPECIYKGKFYYKEK